MKHQVDRDEILRQLQGYSTALVTDVLRRLGRKDAWPTGIKPVSRSGQSIVGRAVTLKFAPIGAGPKPSKPGAFDIIDGCRRGDILVFAALGRDVWLAGENMANFAIGTGLAAFVVDGGIRDSAALASSHLPVFSRSVSPKPYSEELWLEDINVPCMLGGVPIRPDDVIVGDEDGIVIIPADLLDEVLFQLEDVTRVDEALARAVLRMEPVPQLNVLSHQKHVRRQR